jgi:ribonucleoside-diphosphate reductase beta chain
MNKYSIFPINYPEYWEAYKKQQHAFWTAEELDFAMDLNDWFTKLTDDERHYITYVLAFFAQSDGIVNENLAVRFYSETSIPEVRAFYTAQMFIETVHAEVYGLLIETYIKDNVEKAKLFDAINHIPVIAKKAEWALKWLNSDKSEAHRLVAFAIVEGLFFSGSFCSIFWLRKRGLMKGLATANELIARDEGLHAEFPAMRFKTENFYISEADFREIIMEAVEIEKEFVRDALPVRLIGMNEKLMCEYIEYTADRLSRRFNFSKVYNTENPFDFMNMIDIDTKTNFFESRVTAYKKPANTTLAFGADF